ncbi:hypothetical protein GALMADRAFT_262491 [Galerina marginata CBS 339.88]|uniref:Autophagy-related protein 29 n=1 Tax=Galerina marginata (strain CBS 339.88) TaxID=685588 RepID=A0A067TP75_GALM3|nr:hypothetical protein GALMADRAFT_262491 [Galerina marginata CBS 339.88]
MPTPHPVRVVVKLPYNRPENPPNDPPKIEWTAEKADILWKVIERSRSVDSAGADWKGLAAHLEVPLPYLLYRVNARFQEEIRGLRDIQGTLSPTTAAPQQKTYDFPTGEKPPSLVNRVVGGGRLSTSRIVAPLGVRARLSSLGNNSPRPRKATSSSTLTLQGAKKPYTPLRPNTPPTSESESEDEEAIKEEEAERNAEEEEALTRKLADLQKMMTVDTLGLVTGTRQKGKGKDRGRSAPLSPPRSIGSSRVDTLSSRSASQSISSTSSPQGSIPDMPSPSSESQPHSPSRNISNNASSPSAIPSRPVLNPVQRRYGPLVDRTSDFGSSHGSETSSFSDLSDASISASALESALLSNLGTNGSRL